MKDCLQLHLVSNQNVVHSQGVDVTHYLTGASMQSVSLVWRLLPVEVGQGLTVQCTLCISQERVFQGCCLPLYFLSWSSTSQVPRPTPPTVTLSQLGILTIQVQTCAANSKNGSQHRLCMTSTASFLMVFEESKGCLCQQFAKFS